MNCEITRYFIRIFSVDKIHFSEAVVALISLDKRNHAVGIKARRQKLHTGTLTLAKAI